MSFVTPYDIGNRAMQLLGQPRFSTFSDFSMQASESGFVYDKLRRAELRRAVWTYATRRMVIRSKTGTTARLVPALFNPATAYTAGDIVLDVIGYPWLATASNTGVYPPSYSQAIFGYNPMWIPYFGQMYLDAWSGSPTYIPGDVVTNGGSFYLCIAQTTNNAPPNASFWHPIQGASSAGIVTFSPGGYNKGGSTARSAFYLPANFMRLAAQDEKQPGTSHLSVSAGLKWNDWELENGVLYSAATSSPYVLRFVADVQDVTVMDDMFCEGLAARMGMVLNERFTNNKDLYDRCKEAYMTAISQARAMSSIEAGSTEDDFEEEQAQPQQQQQRGR